MRNFEERTNACFNLVKYVDDHVANQSTYRARYERHMSLLHRIHCPSKSGTVWEIRRVAPSH